MLDSVPFKFVRVGCAKDLVACNLRGNDLNDDITIGKADYKTVFRSRVFVLGLGDEAFAGVVVGLTITAAFVFGLEAAVWGKK